MLNRHVSRNSLLAIMDVQFYSECKSMSYNQVIGKSPNKLQPNLRRVWILFYSELRASLRNTKIIAKEMATMIRGGICISLLEVVMMGICHLSSFQSVVCYLSPICSRYTLHLSFVAPEECESWLINEIYWHWSIWLEVELACTFNLCMCVFYTPLRGAPALCNVKYVVLYTNTVS